MKRPEHLLLQAWSILCQRVSFKSTFCVRKMVPVSALDFNLNCSGKGAHPPDPSSLWPTPSKRTDPLLWLNLPAQRHDSANESLLWFGLVLVKAPGWHRGDKGVDITRQIWVVKLVNTLVWRTTKHTEHTKEHAIPQQAAQNVIKKKRSLQNRLYLYKC